MCRREEERRSGICLGSLRTRAVRYCLKSGPILTRREVAGREERKTRRETEQMAEKAEEERMKEGKRRIQGMMKSKNQ